MISLSGGYLISGNFITDCDAASFVSNQGGGEYFFPPYYEESFCSTSIGDPYGIVQPYTLHPNIYPPALWLFSQIGSCRFAFTSFNAFANNVDYRHVDVGSFSVAISFGLYEGQSHPWIQVTVSSRVKVAYTGSCDSIDYPMFTGIALPSANYYASAFQNYYQFLSLTSGSQATSEIQYLDLSGNSFCSPDCGVSLNNACWTVRNLVSQTGYRIYPTLGDSRREFPIWQPNPQIDPWGLLNQPVTATLELGID